jgi:hypothetical protein
MNSNYYAIYTGNDETNTIVSTWEECQQIIQQHKEHIKNEKNKISKQVLCYRKFETKDEAATFLQKDYSNHGKLWSTIEDNKLLQEIQENKSIYDISVLHKRTVGGIESKIKQHAIQDFINNDNIDDINNKYNTNFTSEELQHKAEKVNEVNENKNKKLSYTEDKFKNLEIKCSKLETELHEIKSILMNRSWFSKHFKKAK